ncbi:MAG: COG4223 family protein [Methylocella sp.]
MANDEEELAKIIAGPGAAPGSLRHETSENGGQSQSPAEPEGAATQVPAAEPRETAAPESQSLDGQFSMEPHAPEAPSPEPPAPEAVDGAPGMVAPPPRLAGEQTKPRSLFPALAATAVAGAVLGFGGTLGLRYFGGSQSNGFASGERIAALNARIDAIDGKEAAAAAASRTALAAMETRVTGAENAANKAAESANSAQADAQKAIASQPAVQEPASGLAPAVPDLGPLEARIGTLEQKLAPLEAALAAPKADLRPQQHRADAAAGEGFRAQAIAIVAESLLRKLDSGGQFSGELSALENLGVPQASLAPLRAASESTVLSDRQLTARFATLVPGIIASESAKQASADEGFLDRLTRNAKGLLRIRRVGDAEAAGVQGFVARIENALTDHDLEAAYEAWQGLPGTATTKSESWGEAAKARLDALNAARSIEADAVAVLGKPKS